MKFKKASFTVVFFCLTQTAVAYVPNTGGGGGGGGACAKPKFSHFNPEEKTEVKAGSEFSFAASANTHPKSIKVKIKEIPVQVTVPDNTSNEFIVTGKLPETLKNTFARIHVYGESSGQCKGNAGWLIKIID